MSFIVKVHFVKSFVILKKIRYKKLHYKADHFIYAVLHFFPLNGIQHLISIIRYNKIFIYVIIGTILKICYIKKFVESKFVIKRADCILPVTRYVNLLTTNIMKYEFSKSTISKCMTIKIFQTII